MIRVAIDASRIEAGDYHEMSIGLNQGKAATSPAASPRSARSDSAEGAQPVEAKSRPRRSQIDFLNPLGDPGLTGPGSVAWRVFNNPIGNAVGGIAAVILELAEPSVRAGVWDHSTFRIDPIQRMQNTAAAAFAITYGPKQAAQKTFERVNRMHQRVTGETHDGKPYQAMDPDLLTWVFATAGWGFLNAYIRYVEPRMSRADQERYYAEREAIGYGFGAQSVPRTVAEVEDYMASMLPKLYVNDTVQEFIHLVGQATPMGSAAQPLQRLLVQAAIDLLNVDMQRACGVRVTHPLGRGLRLLVRPLARSARIAQRFAPDGPAQQACRRMGVSTDCLYP
jgi:uncharacterized protein (DUF2236 family)